MKVFLSIAAAAITTGLFALLAMADDDDMTPARLERLDARAKERGYAINHLEAIRIAKTSGVGTVHEIEIELSARDGKVRDVARNEFGIGRLNRIAYGFEQPKRTLPALRRRRRWRLQRR